MSYRALNRSFLLCTLMLAACTAAARATVRVSYEDGAWSAIYWLPAGAPRDGDTVIIASNVTGMPAGQFGDLIIRPWGSLGIDGGSPRVGGLRNMGVLACGRAASLQVLGDLLNEGSIGGEGTLRMMGNGSTIDGDGEYGNMAVASDSGTTVFLAASIVVRSLALGAGNRIVAGAHDLTVNGAYSSNSRFGEPGIEATTGTVHLNGSVYGTASGAVVLGSDPTARVSRRAGFPEVYGLLGDSAGSVRIAASRLARFTTFVGHIAIDSGATLEAGGIGGIGRNIVAGDLAVRGTLTGGDDGYTWQIDGELYNHGRVESCVLAMSGYRAELRSDSGEWDPGISLVYTGTSGSELRVEGALVVSHLTIGASTPLDSNISVVAGRSPMRIRHAFTSDTARNCRIVSDTVVSIWGASHGIVEGDVVFEGFWGSPIAGRYGAPGHVVRVAARKSCEGMLVIADGFVADARAPIGLGASLRLGGNSVIASDITIPTGDTITAAGNLACERSVTGGGGITLTGAAPLVDFVDGIGDSVLLAIGTDSLITSAVPARTLRAPRIAVYPGSTIDPHAGDSVLASVEMRYGVRYASNYNNTSAAVEPADARASAVFGGAVSVLRYNDSAGYVAAGSILAGHGYYVRFVNDTTVWHRGRAINPPLSIPVTDGWNLVGAASVPVRADRVTTTGTTLLTGFLTALGGAQSASVLVPGRAYWVHVSGAGTITLNAGP